MRYQLFRFQHHKTYKTFDGQWTILQVGEEFWTPEVDGSWNLIGQPRLIHRLQKEHRLPLRDGAYTEINLTGKEIKQQIQKFKWMFTCPISRTRYQSNSLFSAQVNVPHV